MFAPSMIAQTSVLAPDNYWMIWMMIAVGVAASIYLEQTYRWAAQLSGPVVALLIAMTLSNVGIIPKSSPVYDGITDYLVPIAIALLLFRASLTDIFKTSRSAFLAVQIATFGSVVGALVAGFVMDGVTQHFGNSGAVLAGPVATELSQELPQMTGMMAASYIGGSVNFLAMKDIYDIDEVLTGSLLVADNFVMAASFVLMFWLARAPWMRRYYPHPHSDSEPEEDTPEAVQAHWLPHPISLMDIARGLAVAITLAMLATSISKAIAGRLESSAEAQHSLILQMTVSLISSKYIWLTSLTVVTATLFSKHLSRIQGTEEIGGYLLYLFLFTIGVPSDFVSVIKNVPSMFLLCAIIAVFNLGLTLLIGRCFRMNLEELLLASNATLGGPPTAAAMAVSLGWKKLVTPGLLIGLWGYIVGTAIGVCITEVLKQFLVKAS